MQVIQLQNLSKTYRTFHNRSGFIGGVRDFFRRDYKEILAVNDLNLTIHRGEFVGLLGENGAGKTTAIKMMTGILHPSQGSIEVMGFRPVERKKKFLKSISFVMGNRSQLIWDLPAIDGFVYQQKVYEIPEDRFRKQLGRLVDLFGVQQMLNVQVRRLSLGQRMKMEIINSLLNEPEVIFLDEPTIGLDLMSQKYIRAFLKEYNRETNATILLTSHYMEDIKSTCSRVVIMNKGNKIFDDTISKLTKIYGKELIVKLLFDGKPPIQELSKFGEVTSRDDEHDMGEVILKPLNNDKAIIGELLKHFDTVRDVTFEEEEFSQIVEKVMYKNLGS